MYNRDTDARHIQAINSSPRLYGRQVKISKTSSAIKTDEGEPGFDANNDLDTRSDTICAGANWKLLCASDQCCDVYGSQENFQGIKDVPIAILATGISDKHGRVQILIVNKTIYSGSNLDHSLINLNQIIHFGIPVSDNPYDSGRDSGIDH